MFKSNLLIYKGQESRCESDFNQYLSEAVVWSPPAPLFYYDQTTAKAAPLPNGQPSR